MNNNHPYELVNISGREVEIDKPLVNAVYKLNKLEYPTHCCCQNLNNSGEFQIGLKSIDDAVILCKHFAPYNLCGGRRISRAIKVEYIPHMRDTEITTHAFITGGCERWYEFEHFILNQLPENY